MPTYEITGSDSAEAERDLADPNNGQDATQLEAVRRFAIGAERLSKEEFKKALQLGMGVLADPYMEEVWGRFKSASGPFVVTYDRGASDQVIRACLDATTDLQGKV